MQDSNKLMQIVGDRSIVFLQCLISLLSFLFVVVPAQVPLVCHMIFERLRLILIRMESR